MVLSQARDDAVSLYPPDAIILRQETTLVRW